MRFEPEEIKDRLGRTIVLRNAELSDACRWNIRRC